MTTPNDPLANALRTALEAERPSPNDDAILARAIARAVSTSTSASTESASKTDASGSDASDASEKVVRLPTRRSSRTMRIALPLAATFAASLAFAAYVSRSSSPPPPPHQQIEQTQPTIAPPPPPATPFRAAETPSLSVHDLPSAKPLAAVASDVVSSPPHIPSNATAAELFRDANTERRAGNIDKAVSAYRALQKRFPDASETQASRVSLGRLLLDRENDPNGALEQFDAYLKGATASNADATLAEEARVGRALAFGKLGRDDDERRAWEELVSRHPQSLHLARARDRLKALGAAPPP